MTAPVMSVLFGAKTVPAVTSSPTVTMFPGFIYSEIFTHWGENSVSSYLIIVSAPSGTGAPVSILAAVPWVTGKRGAF